MERTNNNEYNIGSPELLRNTWGIAYGGTYAEYFLEIQRTSDGGFIAVGYTASFSATVNDIWVIKLDSSGNVEWQNRYGGSGDDRGVSIYQTVDGGYILAGYTNSFGAGMTDAIILKLDSSGAIQWQYVYGGVGTDIPQSIRQTSDNEYIMAGYTNSFGSGNYDFWVVKLTSTGGIRWSKTYGGSLSDNAYKVRQTADNGYIVAGHTNSFGSGNNDIWILKLDYAGLVQWQKTYGGIGAENFYSIQETLDYGFIISGSTNSYGAGSTDAWILKLNSTGVVEWQKAYGGSQSDNAYSIVQTSDNGYIIGGATSSFGGGSSDVWVMKLNSTGGAEWQKTYGGASADAAYDIKQTSDGDYVIGARTNSFGAGNYDFWILKIFSNGSMTDDCPLIYPAYAISSSTNCQTADTNVSDNTASISINTPTTIITATNSQIYRQCKSGWIKLYGLDQDDETAYSIQNTIDNGYIVAGIKQSGASYGLQIIKLNDAGDIQWQARYESESADFNKPSILQVNDGGYIISGILSPYSGLYDSSFLLKIDGSGNISWGYKYADPYADTIFLSMQPTNDNGFIVSGYELASAIIIKFSSDGNPQWDKRFGDQWVDNEASSVQQTTDGGFIVAGSTGDLGYKDIMVVKFDSSGSIQWQKAFIGPLDDYPRFIKQTTDSGYIIVGYTEDSGGRNDMLVIKLSSSGSIQWQKTYERDYFDVTEAYAVQQANDGGYIVVGNYNYNIVILKLSPAGDIEWQKLYDGVLRANVYDIKTTSDGFYIIAGTSAMSTYNFSFLIMKVNANGEINSDCTWLENASLTANTANLTSSDISLNLFDGIDELTNITITKSSINLMTETQCDGFTNLPGSVLNTLRVSKSGSNIVLNWNSPGGACTPTAYGVYRGSLPFTKYDHNSLVCNITGLTYTDTSATANYYYLIVPHTNSYEGSYGRDSNNTEIPKGLNACKLQNTQPCN